MEVLGNVASDRTSVRCPPFLRLPPPRDGARDQVPRPEDSTAGRITCRPPRIADMPRGGPPSETRRVAGWGHGTGCFAIGSPAGLVASAEQKSGMTSLPGALGSSGRRFSSIHVVAFAFGQGLILLWDEAIQTYPSTHTPLPTTPTHSWPPSSAPPIQIVSNRPRLRWALVDHPPVWESGVWTYWSAVAAQGQTARSHEQGLGLRPTPEARLRRSSLVSGQPDRQASRLAALHQEPNRTNHTWHTGQSVAGMSEQAVVRMACA
ncbi:hypothetical protein ACJZ2D_004203 [Fusarium nematophilum]